MINKEEKRQEKTNNPTLKQIWRTPYMIKMGGTWKQIRLLRGETWKQTNVSLEGKNKNIVTRIQNLSDDMHLCQIFIFKQTPCPPYS